MNENDLSLYDKYIDSLLLKIPQNYAFNFYVEISKLENGKSFHENFRKEIKNLMVDYQYIEEISHIHNKITTHGRNVRRLGGHLKYLEQEGQLNKAKKEKEEIEAENTRLSLRNNTWQYRTRWWPHVIALIAVFISLWALLKDEADKEKLKKEIIKELQTKNPSEEG